MSTLSTTLSTRSTSNFGRFFRAIFERIERVSDGSELLSTKRRIFERKSHNEEQIQQNVATTMLSVARVVDHDDNDISLVITPSNIVVVATPTISTTDGW
jgi:hypothetical protein